MQVAIVYIALGTNLGDRPQNLAVARQKLSAAVRLTALSAVHETAPWGVVDQPWFLNQVVSGETELAPEALLHFLKEIEREMGRTPTVRYGPRLIDLDILFYDDRVVETPDLVIPHPRLSERHFVLAPLAELAPDLIHPTLGISVHEMLARLPAS